jgi:hypothetical protein
MKWQGKKLGILLSSSPKARAFRCGVRLAEAALAAGVDVYLYCLDEAVHGVADAQLQALRARGLKLYACAYGARRRHLDLNETAVFAGLTVVNDMITATDRFISFN